MASFQRLYASIILLVFASCNGQGDQNRDCWATLSGAVPGKVKISDGGKGGADRFGEGKDAFYADGFDEGDGRIPQMYAKTGLLLMETANYRAVLVAPPNDSQNFRTGGSMQVTVFVGGSSIGPIPLSKSVSNNFKRKLEALGIKVEKRTLANNVKRWQLKFPDGDRVAADVNPNGEFGAMVLTDDHSHMRNGVCGGPEYFDYSKNVEIRGTFVSESDK